jgi:ATP-dependent helicase/nuclease subunit A
MTVHGAKGLEAPLVILADTTTPPRGTHQPRLVELPLRRTAPDVPACIVWAGRKDSDVGVVATAREAALREVEHEHRRLLYVAMTRAAERLIVCGCQGKIQRRPGCWYDLIHGALQGKPGCAEIGDGDARRWRYCKTPEPDERPPAQALRATPAAEEPAWLTTPVPAAALPAQPLKPSSAGGETTAPHRKVRRANVPEDVKRAMARGTLLHRLLQSLPDVAPSRREEAAWTFLARATDFSAEERERFAAQSLALLADPGLGSLFAGPSRTEVAIVGRIARPGPPWRPDFMVSGQIDRLIVTDDAVLIADYKTNRDAPRSLDAAPQAYVEQLALYRVLISRIYPDRPVRAALVWTELPDLMEIPAAMLDAALSRVLGGTTAA